MALRELEEKLSAPVSVSDFLRPFELSKLEYPGWKRELSGPRPLFRLETIQFAVTGTHYEFTSNSNLATESHLFITVEGTKRVQREREFNLRRNRRTPQKQQKICNPNDGVRVDSEDLYMDSFRLLRLRVGRRVCNAHDYRL